MCATNLDRRDTTPAPPFLNALNKKSRSADYYVLQLCVRHHGISEAGAVESRTAQVGLCQIGLIELRVSEVGINEDGFGESDAKQIGLVELTGAQVGRRQIRFY